MRMLKLGLLSLSVVAGLASPALAGGWWSSIGLDGQPVGIGESFRHHVSEVMFDTIEEAERAKEQTFFVYLVRHFDEGALDDALGRADPGDWWRPVTEPIRAGTVELTSWDANLAEARVRLDVPGVSPGSYHLMLCDAGCDRPLGNLIPAGVTVTDDVLAAQTTRRLLETEARLSLAVQRTRNDLRATRRTLGDVTSRVAAQERRVEALEPRPAQTPESPETSPWIAYAGWFVAGGATLLAISRRRPIREPAGAGRIPDDARELVGTP